MSGAQPAPTPPPGTSPKESLAPAPRPAFPLLAPRPSPQRAGFAARVVAWQAAHGRHGLPWQASRDPYRVWLSETMLQQTQVATVLAFYPRFLARLPTVEALAAADEDTVLGLWSGLGYYSRARNLHRAAREVMTRFGGRFPASAAELETLPGIGRSTAAAIAAFCFGERAAILDANVRRVLARWLGFTADLARPAAVRALWDEATALLPAHAGDMPAYTQGLMDLGATVCLPRAPLCLLCPVQADCAAAREGDPTRYPVRTRTLRRGSETWWLLIARAPGGSVWLQRRPTTGIWGGLHGPPVFADAATLRDAIPSAAPTQTLPPRAHALTHKDLLLQPVLVDLPASQAPAAPGRWVPGAEWAALGLPTPVRQLLATLAAEAPIGGA